MLKRETACSLTPALFRTPPRRVPHHVQSVITTAMVIIIIIIRDIRHRVRRRERGHITRRRARDVNVHISYGINQTRDTKRVSRYSIERQVLNALYSFNT